MKPHRHLRVPVRKSSVQKKGPRRHLRKSLVIILAAAMAAAFLAFNVPIWMDNSKLRTLGYDDETIKKIRSDGLTDKILTNSYYSSYLAKSIDNGSLEEDFISLYTAVSDDRGLTASDFLLYCRLEDKGYEKDQLENLFKNLKFYEITPLLVFDYQWDEQKYIDDCENNKDTNSDTSFSLSGTYITPYKLTQDIDNTDSADILVNLSNGLTSDYVPSDLTDVDTQYAVSGIQLRKEAEKAFVSMASSALTASHNFYASSGYRSYADQNTSYTACSAQVGSDNADTECTRAGHSEHQTALAVNISPTYEKADDFTQTEVYKWMQDNAASYGFIERYPESKSYITHMSGESNHYRYVGKDIAEAVQDSNLTYDEFYELYLAGWNDTSFKPASHIIAEANPVSSKTK